MNNKFETFRNDLQMKYPNTPLITVYKQNHIKIYSFGKEYNPKCNLLLVGIYESKEVVIS